MIHRSKWMVVALVLALALTGVLTACSQGGEEAAEPQSQGNVAAPKTTTPAPEPAETGPKFGGILKVALSEEPPTLDQNKSSLTATRVVGSHFYETLFTFDRDFNVAPLLASDYSVSDDGKLISITLRKGIKFHDGSDFTTEDAVPSLERWLRLTRTGKEVSSDIASITAIDDNTLEITMNNYNSAFLMYLTTTREGAVMMPKELIDKWGDEEIIDEHIGTGPFEFVEWSPGQYIKLKRFEDYVSRGEEPNGYGGGKTAYVDEIWFIPQPEAAVRAAAVEAGDMQYAESVNPAEFDRLKSDPELQTFVVGPAAYESIILNKDHAPLDNVITRHAFSMALDKEELLLAAYGNPDFFRLDCGIMWKETTWWNDAGCDQYYASDTEQARQLLEEAGYDGTPVRWITYEGPGYSIAQVAKEQLEEAGFKIDLQLVEFTVLDDLRHQKEPWEAYSIGNSYRTHPLLHSHIKPTYPGWWVSAERDQLVEDLVRSSDISEQQEIYRQIQQLYYDDMTLVKVGDTFTLNLARNSVKGFANMPQLFFWNVWLDEDK